MATQIFLEFSPRKLGEDELILMFAYFSTGLVKNHQLENNGEDFRMSKSFPIEQ